MAVNEISGFLKFKDTNGDTNLLLPITTKDNVDGLDEIENELANSVKVTAQDWTENQKQQARDNIGAISCWADIKDKPFGEVPGADTVYWDGNREGLVKADGYDRYMVSPATPTLADFENGASNTKLLSGTESTTNLGMGTAIYEAGEGCIVVGNTIVALKDGATLGDEVYPKKGTYFTWIGNDSYTTRLTINGYTGFLVNKKLDPQWLPNHSHNLGPTPIVTSGDGAEYTVTIDGVTELYNGLQFIMIPHTNSTTTAVKLNVNNLGAKMIRQRMGTNTSIGVAGAVDNWIIANKPVTVTYNGSAWMVEIERPDAANIYGVVKVENGGVPIASDADEGAFLRNIEGTPTWVKMPIAEEVSF